VQTCALPIFPDAEGVNGTVEPVVHAPVEKSLLVLHVSGTAKVVGKEFFLVGLPIAVGVGILVDVVGIGLHGQYAVWSVGQYKAGEHQAIDKQPARFIDAVVILVLPS